MLDLRVELDEAARATMRRFGAVRGRILPAWRRPVARALEKGVGIIQRQHRSGPTTTPQRTKVIAGNLRSSYGQDTRIAGREVIGEMGGLRKFARGKALVYLPVHERGALIPRRGGGVTYIRARPPGGAIEAARRRIQPELVEGVRRALIEVVHA